MRRSGGVGKKKKNALREKDLDEMFARIVRAPGKCWHCGGFTAIQCAHLLSRSYRSVRWDEENAVPLCRSCHVRYTHRPVEWHLVLERRFGREQMDRLRHRAIQYDKPNYPLIAARLRGRLQELGL